MGISKLWLTALITTTLASMPSPGLAAEPPTNGRLITVEVTIDNGVDEPQEYPVTVPDGALISEVLAEVVSIYGPYIKIGSNPIWKGKYVGEQILQIDNWRNADLADDPAHPSWSRDNAWWTILVGPTKQRRRGRTVDYGAHKIRNLKWLLIGPNASATTSRLTNVMVEKSRKYTCPPRLYLILGEPYKKKKKRSHRDRAAAAATRPPQSLSSYNYVQTNLNP